MLLIDHILNHNVLHGQMDYNSIVKILNVKYYFIR